MQNALVVKMSYSRDSGQNIYLVICLDSKDHTLYQLYRSQCFLPSNMYLAYTDDLIFAASLPNIPSTEESFFGPLYRHDACRRPTYNSNTKTFWVVFEWC